VCVCVCVCEKSKINRGHQTGRYMQLPARFQASKSECRCSDIKKEKRGRHLPVAGVVMFMKHAVRTETGDREKGKESEC